MIDTDQATPASASFRRHIITYPNAQLLCPTRLVQAGDYQTVLDALPEMLDLCRQHGGYALAANQVGLPLRFFVVPPHRDLPSKVPCLVINPTIVTVSKDEARMSEGCLSMPGLRVSVVRPAKVTLEYATDPLKQPDGTWATRAVTFLCTGLWARVVQHECEHLAGDLFTSSLHPSSLSARDADRYMQDAQARAAESGRPFHELDCAPSPLCPVRVPSASDPRFDAHLAAVVRKIDVAAQTNMTDQP